MVLFGNVCLIFGQGLQYFVGACCASVVLGGGIGICSLCRLSASLLYVCFMCGSLLGSSLFCVTCLCVLLVGCVYNTYRSCVFLWCRVF
jgi:hypothetical protein